MLQTRTGRSTELSRVRHRREKRDRQWMITMAIVVVILAWIFASPATLLNVLKLLGKCLLAAATPFLWFAGAVFKVLRFVVTPVIQRLLNGVLELCPEGTVASAMVVLIMFFLDGDEAASRTIAVFFIFMVSNLLPFRRSDIPALAGWCPDPTAATHAFQEYDDAFEGCWSRTIMASMGLRSMLSKYLPAYAGEISHATTLGVLCPTERMFEGFFSEFTYGSRFGGWFVNALLEVVLVYVLRLFVGLFAWLWAYSFGALVQLFRGYASQRDYDSFSRDTAWFLKEINKVRQEMDCDGDGILTAKEVRHNDRTECSRVEEIAAEYIERNESRSFESRTDRFQKYTADTITSMMFVAILVRASMTTFCEAEDSATIAPTAALALHTYLESGALRVDLMRQGLAALTSIVVTSAPVEVTPGVVSATIALHGDVTLAQRGPSVPALQTLVARAAGAMCESGTAVCSAHDITIQQLEPLPGNAGTSVRFELDVAASGCSMNALAHVVIAVFCIAMYNQSWRWKFSGGLGTGLGRHEDDDLPDKPSLLILAVMSAAHLCSVVKPSDRGMYLGVGLGLGFLTHHLGIIWKVLSWCVQFCTIVVSDWWRTQTGQVAEEEAGDDDEEDEEEDAMMCFRALGVALYEALKDLKAGDITAAKDVLWTVSVWVWDDVNRIIVAVPACLLCSLVLTRWILA